MPLDGGLDLSLEISAGEEGVEDPHAVKVEPVGVRGEMLEEVGQGFGGGILVFSHLILVRLQFSMTRIIRLKPQIMVVLY